jgi:hypothetical protein
VATLPVHLSRTSSKRDYFFRYLNARYSDTPVIGPPRWQIEAFQGFTSPRR